MNGKAEMKGQRDKVKRIIHLPVYSEPRKAM